jgi:hypothetical protein
MEQTIIIKNDSVEDFDGNNMLDVDYLKTSFGTYDKLREYLHIQIDSNDDFNVYVELNPYKAVKLFEELADQARIIRDRVIGR